MEDQERNDNISSDTALATDPAEHINALTAERDQLVSEKAELHDLLLRQRAEFENFRRRSERERLEYSDYAAAEAVRPLLPILDDFERALKASEGQDVNAEFRRGIELIYSRLLETLKKMGLEPIEAAGQPFDPNLHNAIQRVETDEAEDGTVLEEYQRGYNFKGRLLRPSMVKVAVRQ